MAFSLPKMANATKASLDAKLIQALEPALNANPYFP
jgi:hypothetical protein